MHRKLRICVGASAGGHLTQLLRLSCSWEQHSVFCVTTLPIVAERLQAIGPVYVVGECNRHHPIRALNILAKAFKIVWKERPDVVLTTGSMPLALLCLAAKLFGARIIWIDSITNVSRLSVSGRLVRPFANLCLTQWPNVVQRYKNVEYVGAII